MPEEVGIAEKLNELSASLFVREEDELLPKRDMHFPSEINGTQKKENPQGQKIKIDKTIRF